MGAAGVEARNLIRTFGRTPAVRGVSFAAEAGTLVGLLGPNGAGKTTTLRMLAGTLAASSGDALVGGVSVVGQARAYRRRVGYLPEHNPLPPEMRVEEHVGHRAALMGMRGRARREAVGETVERCSLSEVRRRTIGELSKGYKQRVGLAAALVHGPEALLLDEPTSGLDPSQAVETRALLRSLAGTRTVIVSSHLLSEVERMCDRALIVARGAVAADVALDGAREGRGGVIVIEARDPPGALEGALRTVEGAPRVEAGAADAGGWRVIRVWTREGAGDPRERLAKACAAHGALVREMRREREGETLEAAYARAVSGKTSDDSGGGAGDGGAS